MGEGIESFKKFNVTMVVQSSAKGLKAGRNIYSVKNTSASVDLVSPQHHVYKRPLRQSGCLIREDGSVRIGWTFGY